MFGNIACLVAELNRAARDTACRDKMEGVEDRKNLGSVVVQKGRGLPNLAGQTETHRPTGTNACESSNIWVVILG